MHRRPPSLVLAGLLAVAGLLAPGLVPAASADTRDDKLRVVQHNTDGLGPAAALRNVRTFGDVDAVTFQELCRSEARKLRKAGWKVTWRAQRKVATCTKGNAIASKRGLDALPAVDLSDFGGRDFSMLCATIKRSGIAKSHVCTTHLAQAYGGDGAANRQVQIGEMLAYLEPRIRDRGWRVVLTGDFNTAPDTANLDDVLRVTDGGTDDDVFWEGDQTHRCGDADRLCRNMQATTRNKRKYDYFLTSWRGVNPTTGLTKTLALPGKAKQGHKVVRGQVVFR